MNPYDAPQNPGRDSSRRGRLAVEAGVFVLLVALGVAGRDLAPSLGLWNFSPIAAIGVFAGFFFRRLWVGMAAAFLGLTLSNLLLPGYHHAASAAAVYLALLATVFIPRLTAGLPTWGRGVAFALAPAALFFVTTNFAVWLVTPLYPMTAAGLIECYTLALPFVRNTLAGDLFYMGLLFGAYGLATATMSVGQACSLSGSAEPASTT